MKKEQLAKKLARDSSLSTAAATYQIDRVVDRIVRRVRNGKTVSLPGLGRFIPGKKQDFQFER